VGALGSRSSHGCKGLVGRVCLTGVVALLAVPAVASAADRFVYVSNGLGDATPTVSALRINANGSLTPITGSPFATGAATQEGLTLTPNGQFLYVASFGTNQVMKFDVANNGGLSGLQALNPGGTTFTTPLGVAPDPDGQHLFTWNHGNSIAVTTINANGGLSNIAGSPFVVPAGFTNPFAGSVSPNGDNLYVPFENTSPGGGAPDRSGAFSVAANGAVSNIQNVITGGNAGADGNPFGSGITPDGRFVYFSAPEDLASVGRIWGFSTNPNGTLSSIPGSPFLVTPGGSHPLTIATAPDNEHLYVATRQTNAVKAYSIDQNTGALTNIGAFATNGTNGKSLALTPDGERLYVSNQVTNNISGFNVAANGSLSLIPGSPWPTGDTSPDLESIAITPNQGPQAAFTVQNGFAGEPIGPDAANSDDPDGQIARYAWDWGDGNTTADGGPTPTHIYNDPGTFTITLTVTDDEDCSNERIFTGKAMLCNGSNAAVATQQVTVDPNDFERKLKISYKKKKGRFKGEISSDEEACAEDQKVIVYRKQKGKDPKVGSDRTNESERYRVDEESAKGRFYAKVKESALPNGGTCFKDKSRTIKVG